jgi:quercetin dioxygenase-like cupin family protein
MIVHVVVPPGGISEGHTHPYSSEYIMFSIPGKAILDGKEYDVPKMGVVHAKPGVLHECRNTSETETMELYCVFTPPFEPYGIYPGLIEKTKASLEE